MMRSSVDLPHPEGPSTSVTSPASIARLTSRSTTRSCPSRSKRWVTPLTSTSAPLLAVAPTAGLYAIASYGLR